MLFDLIARFFVFEKVRKYDFRGPIWRYYTSETGDVHGISRLGVTHSVDLVRSIWQRPCSGFGDFQGRPFGAMLMIDVSTLDPQDPLWG